MGGFVVLKDRILNGEAFAKAGDIVFRASGYDYGLARDDSWYTGKPHISVTKNADGSGPSFTIAEEDIEAKP